MAAQCDNVFRALVRNVVDSDGRSSRRARLSYPEFVQAFARVALLHAPDIDDEVEAVEELLVLVQDHQPM